MTNRLIFLSHIHEEKALASLIKQAIEDEFSGFVEVFVSSDGTSFPVGTNFLKRIEDALVNCIGAIYLISPVSVKRNWINFELGAVWIRNVMNQGSGKVEIPILPVCHSGITPEQLPQPLNNLNAINANLSSQLEFAFLSLQRAVGGKGKLKTDFDALVTSIVNIEFEYTLVSKIKEMFNILSWPKNEMQNLIKYCEQQSEQKTLVDIIHLDFGEVDMNIANSIETFVEIELKGHIETDIDRKRSVTGIGDYGISSRVPLKIIIPVKLIMRCKELLLS